SYLQIWKTRKLKLVGDPPAGRSRRLSYNRLQQAMPRLLSIDSITRIFMKSKPFWCRVKLNRRDLLAKGSPT
ncbi:MAG: hypothetical protein LBK82_04635, partial [Planctomycetaceae bacterium]|nr:hypothetical protein [Planctomycetaceae bacterium]